MRWEGIEMLGTIIMEVGETEIIAAIQFYLNHSVFHVEGYPSRKYHEAIVSSVKQRKSRFVIEFEGQPEPEWPSEIVDEARLQQREKEGESDSTTNS